jgi:L-2-hydroxyglutarate oxidase LhgO
VTGRVDIAVVGGGIVGLATARAILDREPSLDLILFEKEARLGAHQTTHNSGVLHSGLYYRPGSLKARLCVQGRRRLVEFCDAEGLPIEVCGKLVVARSRREMVRLEDLHERGTANGLRGIERIGPKGIAEHEPHAEGVAALWVPETGVVDFGAVAARFGEHLTATGAELRTGAAVDRIDVLDGEVAVGAGDAAIRARLLVNAAGLHADHVAALAGVRPPARIVPFRGEYFELTDEAALLVGGLIYPVPNPRFPFLGVHFTRKVDGTVEVGPNALLALGREHYRGSRADWSELRSVLGDRGFRRLAARHWRMGTTEMVASSSKTLYASRARRLIPAVRARHLVEGGSGVRAQAVFPNGTLADDFVVAAEGPMVHVLSAPSPAATASPAIGEYLAGLALDRLQA